MFLSKEQCDFFRRIGYLKLPDRIPEQVILKLKDAIYRNKEAKIPPLVENDKGEVIRISGIIDRDEIFREVFTSALLLEPLESLLGPNIEITRNRHNHATINFKGATPRRLHRDVLQWSRSVITALVYLEDSTPENGCTELIPGSQYFQFIGKPNNGGTWMDEHEVFADVIDQTVLVPMPAGGILLIDSLVFHTVGENKTEGTRLSLTMGYRSVDELNRSVNDLDCMLVKGERVYKGNDLY